MMGTCKGQGGPKKEPRFLGVYIAFLRLHLYPVVGRTPSLKAQLLGDQQ